MTVETFLIGAFCTSAVFVIGGIWVYAVMEAIEWFLEGVE